jgi:hypothetical protein
MPAGYAYLHGTHIRKKLQNHLAGDFAAFFVFCYLFVLLRKMGARSGRSASADFAALQLICRRRILGEKEGRIDPVIRGVLV